MTDFAGRTNIIAKLAGKKKGPVDVLLELELAVQAYSTSGKTIQNSVPKSKPLLLQTLLKDEPKALEELKKIGFYKDD